MANKEFKIQSDTISLNGVPLSSSADGKVLLPGVTRATNYQVKEVEDTDVDQTLVFVGQPVTVIDAVTYNDYLNNGASIGRATYTLEYEDGGESIDEINVVTPGAYTSAEATTNENTDMWITDYSGDPFVSFDTNVWAQIPFRPKMRASSVESDLGSGNGNTGSITFEDNNIIGAGEDSGDGLGFDTIRLVPDADLMSNDQYLIIDPTAPGHIHIRAGGTQDASNADLFLGGEKNHVKVNDFNGVRLQNQRLVENFYYYDDATSFTNGGWYLENGNWYVEFTTTNQTMINNFWEFTNGGPNRIVLNQNDTLEYGGWAANTSPDVYKVQVNTGPLLGVQPVGTIEFQLFTTETNNIILENGDFRVDVYDDIRMFGRDIFRLVNYSVEEPIEITTNYNNNSYTWSFQPNGTLNFPDGSTQTTAYTGATPDNETLDSVTGRGPTTTNNITVGSVITTDITNKLSPAVGAQVTGIRPPDGAGSNNGYVWVPDETQISSLGDITGWTLTNSDGLFSTTVVQMRNDLGASWAIQTADALIYTGTYTFTSPDYTPSAPLPVDINVGTNTWTFGANGNLTLPNNGVIRVDGNNVEVGGLTNFNVEASGVVNVYTNNGAHQWQFGDDGNLTVPGDISRSDAAGLTLGANYDVKIVTDYTDNNRTWTFAGSTGSITFPDSTVQETAWAGGRVVAVPGSSTGAVGDQQGDLAFDGSYIYYCTQIFGGITYNVVHNLAAELDANGVDNGYLVQNTYQLPEVGWKVYYNGQVTTIDQVNSSGIPGFYVVFVDSPLTIPGQAIFAWGPASATNIWKRVAWSGDTW